MEGSPIGHSDLLISNNLTAKIETDAAISQSNIKPMIDHFNRIPELSGSAVENL